MRILFYLPVVTPWWFDHIVAPLIDRLAVEAELHVMVPPLWCGTGIGPEQLAGLADPDRIQWHILDGEDHPRLRTGGERFDDLVALVHALDPAITLCRSADLETPSRFPGRILHMMEAAFPPFPTRDDWLVLREHPFDHGVMPALGTGDTESLEAGFGPIWAAVSRRLAAQMQSVSLREAEDDGRILVSLPLEYEHEENFFGRRRPHADNAALVSALAEQVGDDVVLAVTDHPLNLLHCDRTALDAAVARHAGRVRMMTPRRGQDRPTTAVVGASDGMIVHNSKAISIAGYFGKPILRQSEHPTGAWLEAYKELGGFLDALRGGAPRRPSEAAAKSFFAFHAANALIDPIHPETDARLLLETIESPVDRRRWPAAIRRYAESYRERFQ